MILPLPSRMMNRQHPSAEPQLVVLGSKRMGSQPVLPPGHEAALLGPAGFAKSRKTAIWRFASIVPLRVKAFSGVFELPLLSRNTKLKSRPASMMPEPS
ncbi:MAG: hypothetical protein HYY95_03410 [Candidatus Rokubacteria bacterium]|nr:hypothetical protein [Candidatus Rokubacteria bacterium]